MLRCMGADVIRLASHDEFAETSARVDLLLVAGSARTVEVARRFETNRGAWVPIVLVDTEFRMEGVRASMIEADLKIAATLTKPVDTRRLAASIAAALGQEAQVKSCFDRHEPVRNDRDLLVGARILLVEDNEINQELATELLSQAGCVVTAAREGQEALTALGAATFDVVLMDCQMPVMDGYEATRCIREELGLSDLPILAMTANALSGDRERVLAAGMNDHIAKPIDIAEMFGTISRWLATRARSSH